MMFIKYRGGWINLDQVTNVRRDEKRLLVIHNQSRLAVLEGKEADRLEELLNRASVWDLGEEVKPMQGWPTYDEVKE